MPTTAPLIVSQRATGRFGPKCACCSLHQAKARCARGRDAERRSLKRRERAAYGRALRDGEV